MSNEIILQRTLVTGHPDGIFRCDHDALPVDEPTLTWAARHDPTLIDQIVAVCEHAPVRTGALAGLAVALKHGPLAVRQRAARLTPTVCRTGRDLLLLAGALRRLGGFGRLTRRCLGEWYRHHPLDGLRAEVGETVDGWQHRDVLRLCHVRVDDPERNRCLSVLARRSEAELPEDRHVALAWPRGEGRRLIALDASATLDCGAVMGHAPKTVAARWGLAAAAAQDRVVVFRSDGWHDRHTRWRTGISPVNWDERTSLADAVSELDAQMAGPPDPALLVRYAIARKLRVDAFVVVSARAPWTDPVDQRAALSRYRDRAPAASMVVVGLKAGGTTLSDPADPRSWGVQGFEATTPSMVAYLAGL